MATEGTKSLSERSEEALIPQSTVWLMAVTVGVLVANIYYIQPLLAEIARTFGLSVTGPAPSACSARPGPPGHVPLRAAGR